MLSSHGLYKSSWRDHLPSAFKKTKTAHPESRQSRERVINAVYYPNWRVYRGQPPSSMNLKFISHIFYAFAWYVEAFVSAMDRGNVDDLPG